MRSQNTTIQISGLSRRAAAWRRMLDAGNALGLAAMAVLAPMLWTLAGVALPAQAQQLTKLTYGTNWLAEAEHGGFYQAVADGTYKKYGLDVTIMQGGPNNNLRLMMSSGKIDFFMGTDMIQAMSATAEGVPTVVVAGMFQKDPQVLMSHPGEGLDTFASLKDAHVILVSKEAITSFYRWLEIGLGLLTGQDRPLQFQSGGLHP